MADKGKKPDAAARKTFSDFMDKMMKGGNEDELLDGLFNKFFDLGMPGGGNRMRGGKTKRKMPWANGPEPRQREILDRAYAHIESVPYKVSLR